MIYNSPVRKNYFFSKDSCIIAQRKEESDSNSRSLSRSCDSINLKSPNSSFEKIKIDKFQKNTQNFSKLPPRPNIINRTNNMKTIKLRSLSNNSNHYLQSLTNLEDKPDLTLKNKNGTTSKCQTNIPKRNFNNSPNIPKEPVKMQKFQSQNSQISTEVPLSFVNNFLIDDQRPGFVRFSEIIVDQKGNSSRKSKSGKKSSLSILKNRKSAVSCNKIDSSYLRQREKALNEKQKPLDPTKTKHNQILQTLRQKFYQRAGRRQYSYYDLHEEDKYKDDLFPASMHSLFYSRTKQDEIKNMYLQKDLVEFVQIAWKRISDLFPSTQKLTMYKEESTQKVVKNDFSLASNDFILSMNAMKNVSQFFNKVFQSQCDKYEKHGIYCLKIYQQNCWKSIIVDDYIPVIGTRNKQTQQTSYKPLFIDVEIPRNGQQIEVWPFLLQKAYASYYNNYESLHESFNIIDWLEEVLMTPSQCYFFPDNQQLSQEVVKKLQKNICEFPTSQSIIIGINMKTKQPCIIEKRPSQASQQITVKTLKSQRKMKIKHLFEIINTFYLFLPFQFKYFNSCPVNFHKGKKPIIQHPMTKIKYRDQIFVRNFVIDCEGPFSIALRQKEKRFYQRNIKKYEYLWNRVVLIQKQFGESYRWIVGKYSNSKSINFNLYLEKGEYILLIMPEPSPEETLYDLTMIMLSNIQIGIEKKLYEQKQRLLEMACCDIAQRKGTFKQLNDFSCSYSFIERSSALIIENINNEKSTGKMAITRSIAGLKAKTQICPFNLDFCINQYEANIHKRKYKKTLQILIENDNHFTVVLMMKGGIDEKFFKVFKFGN